MNDEYQIGSSEEWLKHSNEEMARLVKRSRRQAGMWRFISVLLLAVLIWVVYQFSRHQPLSALWGG